MPVTRGTYAELLAPGLNMQTFTRYREKSEIYRRINRVLDSTRAFEEDFAISGFGPLAPKGELEQTILDEPFKLGGTRWFHRAFALGFVISEEMREDGMYPLMQELAGELGRSSRYTAELWGHDVWNNAFDASKYVGRDGQPLISTAHPIVGLGTTSSNRPAIDTDLSMAALEAAWANFQSQVNDRGIPIDSTPNILLVHPSNFLYARQLLQSSGDPAVDNPAIINPLQNWVQPVASPYLVDPDAWFLIDTAALDVRFYWRKKPDTKTWDDQDTDATIHKIKQRHSVGFGDWRNTYGSPGA
jgi:phage major head subunit gpT-like protein